MCREKEKTVTNRRCNMAPPVGLNCYTERSAESCSTPTFTAPTLKADSQICLHLPNLPCPSYLAAGGRQICQLSKR